MKRHAKAVLAVSALLLPLILSAALASAATPVVSIDPASQVIATVAHLSGEVNPEEKETSCRFEYTTQETWEAEGNSFANANQIACDPGPLDGNLGNTAQAVEADLENLSSEKTYHLRLIAENEDGTDEAIAANFATEALDPPEISAPLSVSAITATSAHFDAEVDPRGTDPASATSWSFSCVPSPCFETQSGTVSPGGAQAIATDTAHLQPNTEYTVTLHASNQAGAVEESKSFKTPEVAPSVEAFAAGPIQATQVSINGQINPNNLPTEYWFEWGTADCSANPCQAIPATKDADAGSGGVNVYVSRLLTGLSSQTTYHFRLLAKNASGLTEGADQTFTTASAQSTCPNPDALGASQLPDCRAWEMVSPPDKHGGNVTPSSQRVQSAADGDGVTFSSNIGFGGVQGSTIEVEYMGRRDARPGTNGWSTHAITPRLSSMTFESALLGPLSHYDGDYSPDLSKAVFQSARPLSDAPNVADVQNLYLREDLSTPGGGSYRLLSDSFAPISMTPLAAALFAKTFAVGTSADFSHVAYESTLGLVGGTSTGPYKLYENAAGTVRLVGRVPQEPETFCDDAGGPAVACVAAASSQPGIKASTGWYSSRMVSADGSRIFFQAPVGSAGGANGGKIYMREDGARTLQLNASEKAVPEKPQDAQLWEASRDGSRAFFTTSEGLVEGDNDGNVDLYMYDVEKPEGERLTLLSVSADPATDVIGVIGAGDDGHYVYFFGHGQLVAGEPPAGLAGELYLWHDGQISYIGGALELEKDTPRTPWNFAIDAKTSRITPDGRHLLFMSPSDEGLEGRGGFTGYDQLSKCQLEPGFPDGGCRELYLYDADSGRLRCASCNPSGAPATSNALDDFQAATANNGSSHQSHALSDDGRYVFFSTRERLVQEDTNGTYDAYVYDTQSEEPHLLSSGEDKNPSYFMDASADGNDAFIATAEQLSRWDTDTSYDLYDARVGGGLPEPLPPPPSCQGDACQPTPRQLSDPTPASSSFKGAGNRQPRKHRKHKRRRHSAAKRHQRAAKHNRRAGR